MSLIILLRCLDYDETRQFYESALGFVVTNSAEGTLTVELNGGRLIFTCSDLWEGTPRLSGTLYFTVANVDVYFATVRDRVSVAWPVQSTLYGSREFGVKDCNGYFLAFHEQA